MTKIVQFINTIATSTTTKTNGSSLQKLNGGSFIQKTTGMAYSMTGVEDVVSTSTVSDSQYSRCSETMQSYVVNEMTLEKLRVETISQKNVRLQFLKYGQDIVSRKTNSKLRAGKVHLVLTAEFGRTTHSKETESQRCSRVSTLAELRNEQTLKCMIPVTYTDKNGKEFDRFVLISPSYQYILCAQQKTLITIIQNRSPYKYCGKSKRAEGMSGRGMSGKSTSGNNTSGNKIDGKKMGCKTKSVFRGKGRKMKRKIFIEKQKNKRENCKGSAALAKQRKNCIEKQKNKKHRK